MRISSAILLAVVAVFTSSGLASASNPVQLQQAVPGSTNNVENADGGARLLRKRVEDESEELANEERGILGDLAKKMKQYLNREKSLAKLFEKRYSNGDQRLVKLFEKSDEELMKNEVGPLALINAANRIEKGGWPSWRVEQFKAKAQQYSTHYYNNLQNIKGFV